MRATHRQNGTRATALLGSLVAVLSIVLLVVVLPVSTASVSSSNCSGADSLSISAARTTVPQSALHTITSTANGFTLRHVEMGSGASAFRTPLDHPQRFESANVIGRRAPESVRPSLRVLLCSWLN